MYAGVPSTEPVLRERRVSRRPVLVAARSERATSTPRASPKSVTAIRPSRLRSTLCGLKSRWTSPAACAAASPRPAARNAATISAGVRCAALSHSIERLALDELHRDEVAAAGRADLVHGDDVGMREPRHRARLAQQALASLVVAAVGLQDLERDAPLEIGIERGVDDAHAADAELALEAIAAERSRERRHRSAGTAIRAGRRRRARELVITTVRRHRRLEA